MQTAITVVEIIFSIVLILVVMLQAKGSGFSGALGGDSSSIYRSRRGIEKRLFQFTIIFAALFLIWSLISSIYL